MLRQLNDGVKERLTWVSVTVSLTLLMVLFRHPFVSLFLAGVACGQMDSIIREFRADARADKIIKRYKG